MKNWNKRQISKEAVAQIHSKYGVDPLTASILLRRGVTEGSDIQYYLENDCRFLHNPFLFSNMEDVVDRILQAKEEGEKVLVFGDRDVDGITSTTVLYDYLSSIGIDVQWRLPGGADPYGLNKRAIDDFSKDYGSLIITVDCGISNVDEIAYASELGMDVIVLDHHNPPELLPSPAIIIDPKCADSGYPFKDISGCAVAFKVVSALRFARSDLYKNEVSLLSVRIENGEHGEVCFVDVLKTQNLVEKAVLSEKIEPGTSITNTKLPDFLRGQQIFVWNMEETKRLLSQIFGSGTEFNMMDLRTEVSKIMPQMANISLSQLRSKSKIARYNKDYDSEIRGFFNIFVTFMNRYLLTKFPGYAEATERDLQLVALAALADIMPLKDENRILVRQGTSSLNAGKAREGLMELLSLQKLLDKRITSVDLSWNIVPVLNATGRLGQPEIGIELFLEKDPSKRAEIAQKIISMNNERKQLGNEAWEYGSIKAKESIEKYGGKLCVIIDERINRGVSGILAGRLVSSFGVPSMAITFVDGVAIGSMRSCRGFDVTDFLDAMSDIFISHGGHNYAAGFSFEKDKLPKFLDYLDKLAPGITLGADESETFDVDAELPYEYLKPSMLDVVDRFEPYGEANRELLFMSRNMKICGTQFMGKVEQKHLKLTFDCGETKWPAIFWGGAEYMHRDFEQGDYVDVLYKITRNTYNGVETPQLIITDIRKSLQ